MTTLHAYNKFANPGSDEYDLGFIEFDNGNTKEIEVVCSTEDEFLEMVKTLTFYGVETVRDPHMYSDTKYNYFFNSNKEIPFFLWALLTRQISFSAVTA